MEIEYTYRVFITLRRTARISVEELPAPLSYGKRVLVIDLCSFIVESPEDYRDAVLDFLYDDIRRRTVEPFIDRELEKRAHVIIEKVDIEISTVFVIEEGSSAKDPIYIDLDDYLDELVQGDLCVTEEDED